ncbi:hypothetical protein BC941DRAFT_430109 [Chlamydoabsidia padenii]|nr:hypothetical protein BC941DRAFT_430109 [Chlamydoabsidia padenii]
MMNRLKVRLALANFKREYGYERYDLCTLESNLLPKPTPKQQQQQQKQQKKRHRYYPTGSTSALTPIIKPTTWSRYSHKHRRRISYPTLYSFLLSQCPLSAKRSTSPDTMDEEDAAHLLVMLHNRNE